MEKLMKVFNEATEEFQKYVSSVTTENEHVLLPGGRKIIGIKRYISQFSFGKTLVEIEVSKEFKYIHIRSTLFKVFESPRTLMKTFVPEVNHKGQVEYLKKILILHKDL